MGPWLQMDDEMELDQNPMFNHVNRMSVQNRQNDVAASKVHEPAVVNRVPNRPHRGRVPEAVAHNPQMDNRDEMER